MQRIFLATAIIMISVSLFSCADLKDPRLKNEETPGTDNEAFIDTLSNEPQCIISIDEKPFIIPEDSISAAYTFSDSSVILTFKGIGDGQLRLDIPNIFKCPAKVPTGYSSIRFKMYGTEQLSTEPTVYLQKYPEPGLEFNNLVDGHTKTAVKDNAFEITSIRKTEENSSNKWAVYLIKGKINTTVFKSAYEAKGNDKNYEVNGRFVLQTKIYF